MNTKNELLKLAKCIEAEHRLQKRIEALRKQRGQAGWFCAEWRENCLIVSGSLAEVMILDPQAKAEWHTFPCDDGSVKGYFVYGPVLLGEIRPGFHAWLKHETKSVIVSEAPKASDQVAA